MVVLAMLGLGRLAHADAVVNLNMTATTGLTSTFDGWTISFQPLNYGSCTQYVANSSTFTNTKSADCSGVQMVESLDQGSLVLTFEGLGGAPLLSAVGSSATACGGSECYRNYSDLNMNFTVTAPTGVTMSTASLSLTGSATLSGGGQDLVQADLQNITAGESSSSYNPNNMVTSFLQNPNETTTAFNPGVNSFSVSKDLNVTGDGSTPGATLVLGSVTQVFTPNPAPEPVSISLLAVGVGGLAAARRRRRR